MPKAINFTQLQNLLFNQSMQSPYEFWLCLGQLLKTIASIVEPKGGPDAQYCNILRGVTLVLFRCWKQNCAEDYQSFKNDLEEAMQWIENQQEQTNLLQMQDVQYESRESHQGSNSLGSALYDSNRQQSHVSEELNLQDIQVLKNFLLQNEKII